MDRITLCELDEWLRAGRSFTLLDVRREHVRTADGADIPGARWVRPEDLLAWKDQVPRPGSARGRARRRSRRGSISRRSARGCMRSRSASHVFADDPALLAHGFVMYDALYAWCRQGQGETYAGPPRM